MPAGASQRSPWNSNAPNAAAGGAGGWSYWNYRDALVDKRGRYDVWAAVPKVDVDRPRVRGRYGIPKEVTKLSSLT